MRQAEDTLGSWPPYDAVIFDMDGVVLQTAHLHAAAWKQLFDDVLADPRAGGPERNRPFDTGEDYRRYVDGRRREDGITTFLHARDIDIPVGRPDDAPGAWSVHGLAARKNELFHALIGERGVEVFTGAAALIRRLRNGGTPIGLVTASRNAEALLEAAGLADAFDVVVDGSVSARLGLPGKPDPATFLEAAQRLGVTPSRAAVIEDAVSGVAAASRGGFGLVVGIDRAGRREDLERAGADFVLNHVAELDLGASRSDPWLLAYEGFEPTHETHRETLTTLGNGYLATRGAEPERMADRVHYPGTYIAGVYNRLVSEIDGHARADEDIVNAPNWLPLDVRVEEGPWWSAGGLVIEQERRELDLRRGLLTRTVRLIDRQGRRLEVVQRRLVSMDRPHLAAMETTLTARGWSGQLSVRSGVDATVENANTVESPLLASRHLVTDRVQTLDDTVLVEARTNQSNITIATAVRTTVAGADSHPVGEETEAGRPMLRFDLLLRADRPVVVEKLAAIATSRDRALSSPREGVLRELEFVGTGFAAVLDRHAAAWGRLWEEFEVKLDTDDQTQLITNLHIFHLLQTISPHTADLDVGIPARGLHGEGYRGHVFWDELFVLPLFVLRRPAVARALLDYRWRRLDAARLNARAAGLSGSMFPWQSGSDGREETPRQLFNPRSGRWMPDNSSRQLHVGLAVAYNAWAYYEVTGDLMWLADRGAELLVEVARLFADLAAYDPRDDRFHISGVMGPDEFHDGYPEAPGAGVIDNAYTNVMAAWVFHRSTEILSLLSEHERDELCDRLGVRPEEPARWAELTRRIAVPFHDGVISQFDGYERLAELDWERYRNTYGNIGRLDLILEAENDSTNCYRLAKQADVLMLVYLLGPDDLIEVLNGLGYTLTWDDLARTVDYYLERTANGSTLSLVAHTSVLAMMNRATAWSEFREALDADLDDIQGGTTGHGIHLGAMAGTVDIVLRTFTGMRVEADTLVFTPRPPGGLRCAEFQIGYRGQRISVTLDHETLRLCACPSPAGPVQVQVGGLTAHLGGGQTLEFKRGEVPEPW